MYAWIDRHAHIYKQTHTHAHIHGHAHIYRQTHTCIDRHTTTYVQTCSLDLRYYDSRINDVKVMHT